MHETMDSMIGTISGLIGGNMLLSALVALTAGVLSSLSPCLMTTVPLIVGYIGSDREHNQRRRGVLYSLSFCAGVVLIFTLFGLLSAVLGVTFSEAGAWWSVVIAALLVLVALDMLDVVHILHRHSGECACGEHHHVHTPRATKKGAVGAFVLGLTGGVFTAPCATPALVVILALVSQQHRMLWGLILLLCYAVGHCALIMAAGCSVGFINRLSSSRTGARVGRIARVVFGVLLLLLAAYVLYEGFFHGSANTR